MVLDLASFGKQFQHIFICLEKSQFLYKLITKQFFSLLFHKNSHIISTLYYINHFLFYSNKTLYEKSCRRLVPVDTSCLAHNKWVL